MSNIEKATKDTTYTTQIDWTTFVVEYKADEETRRGISLRKLVDAGLYVNYRDALSAAQKAGMENFAITAKFRTGTRGPMMEDLIFKDLDDAQVFCIMANTDTGKQIARLILKHHTEFQKLLNGDQVALSNLAQVQPVQTDPVLMISEAISLLRKEQIRSSLELEEVRKAIEIQNLEVKENKLEVTEMKNTMNDLLNSTKIATGTCRDPYTVGSRCVILSNALKPHQSAVIRQAYRLGLHTSGDLYQVQKNRNDRLVDAFYITKEGADKIKEWADQLRSMGFTNFKLEPIGNEKQVYYIQLYR